MNEREKEVMNAYEIIENHYHLNDNTDLVYCDYDGGWYIHDLKNDRLSAIYATRGEACEAYTSDSVEWETK